MAPDNLDGKAGANGRPFEGATLRLHRIIRETMAAGDMQRHGDTTARRHGGTARCQCNAHQDWQRWGNVRESWTIRRIVSRVATSAKRSVKSTRSPVEDDRFESNEEIRWKNIVSDEETRTTIACERISFENYYSVRELFSVTNIKIVRRITYVRNVDRYICHLDRRKKHMRQTRTTGIRESFLAVPTAELYQIGNFSAIVGKQFA